MRCCGMLEYNVDTCSAMIDEMWNQPEAFPFHYPVDLKLVPLYKKIIKRPIDLSLIRTNIQNNKWAFALLFSVVG